MGKRVRLVTLSGRQVEVNEESVDIYLAQGFSRVSEKDKKTEKPTKGKE